MSLQTIHFPFDVALPPSRLLKAGKLDCLYEEGKLRYIKYDSQEVIRMIYFAVRDEAWDTASHTIEKEKIDEGLNSFHVSYTSIHQLNGIRYKAEVSIAANEDSISFAVKGEALSTFKKNRIGICVLHPLEETKEREVSITKPDASSYEAHFPALISPHQPFKNIVVMKYSTADGVLTEIHFEGDVFETEDQRNWADATYKTYSTPLDRPFPVTVETGDVLHQRVRIHLSQGAKQLKPAPNLKEIKTPFPKIGYSRGADEVLNDNDIDLLKKLPLDHYRVELFLSESDWQIELATAVDEAKKLATKLALVLFFKEDSVIELRPFLSAVKEHHALIESILPLQVGHSITPPELLSSLYNQIRNEYPDISIGYGTDGFFADLNRNRPTTSEFDFVSFSLNPQVHASDTRSIIENLERLPDLIQTVASFAGKKAVHVSPITFKIRSQQANDTKDFDVRQHTAFGAFWTLAVIKNLSGTRHLSFYEAKSYRGILQEPQSPLFAALKKLKEFKPVWIIHDTATQGPLSPIILENENGERLQWSIDDPLN